MIDASELTELFGACEVTREATEDTEELDPCEGVDEGAVLAVEYPEPNSRRVEENRRDGRRRDVEYCQCEK